MKTSMAEKKFSCVQGCSDCCVYREYYPSKQFGKIGVLLLPSEVPEIEMRAQENGVNVKILPRIAVGKDSPEKIVAYQMMGKSADGDLCPFLDTDSGTHSPHGGLACRIYENRPLACRAYPLLESGDPAKLDEHCRFCRDFSTSNASA
ncbi:MAG: YkgJ family cysteine cluster protein, partial [Nitrososphaera sp.]